MQLLEVIYFTIYTEGSISTDKWKAKREFYKNDFIRLGIFLSKVLYDVNVTIRNLLNSENMLYELNC